MEALAEVCKQGPQNHRICNFVTCRRANLLNCSMESPAKTVVMSIVPLNFPFMVPMWTLPIVVGLENRLIVKPSEKSASHDEPCGS
ncbi:hypothetical protein BC830DRAFT_1231367 [Chytriomyces sp. MP71]|nr:hypothetical protein BC830DRAFT_1231367 [Chytriomyces sp. MP71]